MMMRSACQGGPHLGDLGEARLAAAFGECGRSGKYSNSLRNYLI